MEKPGLSFRVDRAIKDKLVALAAAEKRPLAQYLALVLAEHAESMEVPAPAKAPRSKRKGTVA